MSMSLDTLKDKAEEHSAFTRRLNAPPVGPWKGYWREAAIDLQHALDLAIIELKRVGHE